MKVLKRIGIIVGIIVLSIGVLILGMFGFLNIAQVTYYSDYQSKKEDVSLNYGLNSPYTPQGVEYIASVDRYITSVYGASGVASKIMVADDKGFDLKNSDGTNFDGHVGGIAVHPGTDSILISGDGPTIEVARLSTIIGNIENPGDLVIADSITLPITPSFVYVGGDMVYVGEFYNGSNYMASGFEFVHEEEISHALLLQYEIQDLLDGEPTPLRYVALPNQVQGFAFYNEHMYLSTSYGLADSHIFTYDASDLPEVLASIDNKDVQVEFLDHDHQIYDLKAPCMSEDLTIAKGKVVTMFESACTKYIIGKFYFANYIVALDILVE